MRRVILLLCAVALGGCGLLIDPVQGTDAGNPPIGMDAQVGMDAGSSDAGPPADCDTDEECDDGLLCNGVETCEFGQCLAGTPVECGDGIGCTDKEAELYPQLLAALGNDPLRWDDRFERLAWRLHPAASLKPLA